MVAKHQGQLRVGLPRIIALMGLLCLTSEIARSADPVMRSLLPDESWVHAGSLSVGAYPKWETAVVGPIPAILGAVQHGSMLAGRFNPAVKIVAVVTQDRGAHALMISAEMHQEISADPAQKLLGQRLLLTDASTAQLFAEKCLGAWNVNLNQMTIVKGEQAQLRRSLAQGDAPVGVFWTPFTYRAANDDAKAKQLPCEGVNDLDLPTVIVARADLLNEADPIQLADNRKRIAQVVARHLGAWALAKKKPIDAAKRLVRVYKDQENITISENQAKAELAVRQPPDLAAQRIAFKAPVGGVAPIAATLDGIIDFTVRTGTISATERPIGSDLIDASIIETIAADQTLLKLARGD